MLILQAVARKLGGGVKRGATGPAYPAPVAALAMSGSSLMVAANALLLKRTPIAGIR